MIKKYVSRLSHCISGFWPCPIFLCNSLASIFIQANCAAPFRFHTGSPYLNSTKPYSSSRFSISMDGTSITQFHSYLRLLHLSLLTPATPKDPISFESPQDSSPFLCAHSLPLTTVQVAACLAWLTASWCFNCLLISQSLFPQVFSSNCEQNGILKIQIWHHSPT